MPSCSSRREADKLKVCVCTLSLLTGSAAICTLRLVWQHAAVSVCSSTCSNLVEKHSPSKMLEKCWPKMKNDYHVSSLTDDKPAALVWDRKTESTLDIQYGAHVPRIDHSRMLYKRAWRGKHRANISGQPSKRESWTPAEFVAAASQQFEAAARFCLPNAVLGQRWVGQWGRRGRFDSSQHMIVL